MIIQNKPDINYGLWADNGNIEIPSSEKVENGWVIEKPLNETMNWLQNRSDRMLQYLNQRGIPEWDIRTEYPTNAYVARIGSIYQAISDNTDSDPSTNPAIWKLAFVSYAEFLEYANTLDSITDEDGYLGFYVKKSDPVLDAPAKGDAYYNKTALTGLTFEGEVPVIKSEGVNIVEFSGGMNPKDVVTHEQLALAIQNYKVGDIYITTVNEDPSNRLGYGSWQRFAEGRTLVGFSTSVSNSTPEWVKTSGNLYGSYTHKLSISEIPSHSHDLSISRFEKIAHDGSNESDSTVDRIGSMLSGYVGNTGGGGEHNNVQPSIVVYFWKRTA